MWQFVLAGPSRVVRVLVLVTTVFVASMSLLENGERRAVFAMPAYAGGLANPVVPLDISKFNPPAPTEAGMAPSDVGCPPTDGTIPLYIPDPDSCTKYTVCSGPFGMQMECPPGMHFSVKTSSCTFPPLAGCPLSGNNVTETISFTDLKGPPGIDATAYPMGIPSRDEMKSGPSGNMGQLPDLSFISNLAPEAKTGMESTGPSRIVDVNSDDAETTTHGSLKVKIMRFMSGGGPPTSGTGQNSDFANGPPSSDSAGEPSAVENFGQYIEENFPQPGGPTAQPADSSGTSIETSPTTIAPSSLADEPPTISTEKIRGLLSRLRQNKLTKTTT